MTFEYLMYTIIFTATAATIDACERHNLPLETCGDYVFANSMFGAIMKLIQL